LDIIIKNKENTLNKFTSSQLELIKWIAIITMFIDHIGRLLYENNMYLTSIGRIAFPLFAFLISYNYIFNTKNKYKYMLRLFVLGCISQYVYVISFHFHDLNIFFTLLLGLLLIESMEFIKVKSQNIIESIVGYLFIAIIFTGLGFFVNYLFFGVGLIYMLYTTIKSYQEGNIFIYKIIGTGIIIFLMNFVGDNAIKSMIGIISLYIIYKANSINIKIQRINKYFFYFFYPMHIYLLKLISFVI
jgi:hypothetical protein